MRRQPPARIGEADILEHDTRIARSRGRRDGRGRQGAFGVQQGVDAHRRGLPQHALVQHAAQVAQRAEDLGSRHQHDQQRRQRHRALAHPPGPQHQRRRGAECHGEVGQAARQQPRRQHPERVARQREGALGQAGAECPALPERFQGRQALHPVEELLAKSLEGARAGAAGAAVERVHRHRCDQRGDRGDQQHGRDRHVPERHEHRRSRTARRPRSRAAARIARRRSAAARPRRSTDSITPPVRSRREPGRPEALDLLHQFRTQPFLHCAGGAVGRDGARVVEHRAQPDRGHRAAAPARSPPARGHPRTPAPANGRGRRSGQCRRPAPAGRAARRQPGGGEGRR